MTNEELKNKLCNLKKRITEGQWRVSIDDSGDWLTGGYPSIWSEEADTAIVHVNGFKQEYWESDSLKKCLANAELISVLQTNLDKIIDCLSNVDSLNEELDDLYRQQAYDDND